MDDAVVIVRVVLAAVFVVSATAKLSDRPATAQAAKALGVPAVLAPLVPYALPAVELTLAASFFPVSFARWGGAGLAALMVVFIALVAANLVRGRRPSCHCFGAIDTEPISGLTIVRNVVLLAAALFVAFAGERPGADIFATGAAVDVFAFAGLVGFAFLVARVPSKRERSATAPSGSGSAAKAAPRGPAVGERSPVQALTDLDGKEITLASLSESGGGTDVLMVVGDLGCGSCNAMLPLIEAWQEEYADLFTPIFVVSATPERARPRAEQHRVDHFLLHTEGSITDALGGIATPSALVIKADGTVGTEVAGGRDAIRELVDRLTGAQSAPYRPPAATRTALEEAPRPSIGAPAPQFRLPSVGGAMVDLEDIIGGTAVFVFAQPGSSYTIELLDELRRQRDLARRAVLVATASMTPDDRLACPVLVDTLGLLAATFGVTAVPSAVAIDGFTVSTDVVVGVDNVLDVLRGRISDPVDAEEVTADFVPRPAPRVVAVSVNGTTVVADPSTQAYHSLAATGGVVWPLFDGRSSIEEIATELSAAFEAPVDVVRDDVLEFTRQLGAAGVLDGVRRSKPKRDIETSS